MTLAVEIEDRASWPRAFVDRAMRHRSLALDYHHERLRIDHLCQADVSIRANPPRNRHEEDYQSVVDDLESVLMPHRIVAYHCTRLTKSEIKSVKTLGLQVLSTDLVQRRLRQCLDDGHMSQEHHDELKNSQSVASNLKDRSGKRTGMVWFCPNCSTLQDEHGIYRLFRSWGGEAVYCDHEVGPIASVLSSIGTPCIVRCAIPFSRARQFHNTFSERFLSQLLSDEIKSPEPSARFDLYTEEAVPASEVLEIIRFADPRFEELTRYRNWEPQYRIN